MNKFIDISEYNIVSSYNGLSKEGLKGVIIKATEGTTLKDRMTEKHYNNLNGLIPIGFYHYLTSTSDPKTQAENFWNVIKDKQFKIVPVLDVEEDRLKTNAGFLATVFMEKFKELSGMDMIVYSYESFIEDYFREDFRKSNIFWVANYGKDSCPVIENCYTIAWQYTESCTYYSSVSGKVDCSYLYDESKFYLSSLPTESKERNLDIADLQCELNRQGFRDKNGNSLFIDNVAGELTLSACPILRFGCSGNITRWIQKQLGISQDGYFGSDTEQAVIEFQSSMSIEGDGIIGKVTWSKLLKNVGRLN